MRPFEFIQAHRIADAVAAAGDNAQFLAGGTTLLDLMKLDVMFPARVVDINALHESAGNIEVGDDGLRLGALVHMSEAADHEEVRSKYPVIAQSLALAAS